MKDFFEQLLACVFVGIMVLWGLIIHVVMFMAPFAVVYVAYKLLTGGSY